MSLERVGRSRRYPIHWGGLFLGMIGFPYRSHHLGGFVRKGPEDLYGRRQIRLRYDLVPYILTQAGACAAQGLLMVPPCFLNSRPPFVVCWRVSISLVRIS